MKDQSCSYNAPVNSITKLRKKKVMEVCEKGTWEKEDAKTQGNAQILPLPVGFLENLVTFHDMGGFLER